MYRCRVYRCQNEIAIVSDPKDTLFAAVNDGALVVIFSTLQWKLTSIEERLSWCFCGGWWEFRPKHQSFHVRTHDRN